MCKTTRQTAVSKLVQGTEIRINLLEGIIARGKGALG